MTIPVILVMGVSGVGKSTIAKGIAKSIGAGFVEADQFHPPENIAAMSAGIPLTDDMRWGWLDQVAQAVVEAQGNGPVVFSCSALKFSYRERLREQIGAFEIVYLHGARELIAARMAARSAHFMPPRLLDSQLADLQPPIAAQEKALWLNISETPAALITRAVAETAIGSTIADRSKWRRTS